MAKVRALNEDGITAFHWCGSYELPPATATGSVERDLCLLPSCLGVGEVAVSDHRGSVPTAHELARLALEARRGGLLGGKPGLVHVHMGGGPGGLQPLLDALDAAGGVLPRRQFHPTHMARSAQLVAQGAQWLRDGGSLDLTCECAAGVRRWRCCTQNLPPTLPTSSPPSPPGPSCAAAQHAGRRCRRGASRACRWTL